jgi:rod shape-determining protein MreC
MRDSFSRTLQTTITFLIVAGVLVLAFSGYFRAVSAPLTGGLASIQGWFATRTQAIQEFLAAPADLISLRTRNAELEAQVSQLQTQVIDLQQRAGETEVLAALVDFSRANPESSYKAASVIGRDPSPFLHYVIVNRGSNDGIERGMPVVTNEGLAGRIDAVISDAARVQLLTDAGASVNVHLKNANTDAMLQGSVTGDISLDLISQDATIDPGDIVLTSGLGGGYPPDLIVGQVTNVRKLPAELFQQATVQPAVDFSRLQIVLIITNFRAINTVPLVPTPAP